MDRPRRALYRSDEAADGRDLRQLHDLSASRGRDSQHGGAGRSGNWSCSGDGDRAGGAEIESRECWRVEARVRRNLRGDWENSSYGSEFVLGDPGDGSEV